MKFTLVVLAVFALLAVVSAQQNYEDSKVTFINYYGNAHGLAEGNDNGAHYGKFTTFNYWYYYWYFTSPEFGPKIDNDDDDLYFNNQALDIDKSGSKVYIDWEFQPVPKYNYPIIENSASALLPFGALVLSLLAIL